MKEIPSDIITESAIWKLKGIISNLNEAMSETDSVFERVQLGRVRDKADDVLRTATDARNILRKEGR
jgi:hypothetical protein